MNQQKTITKTRLGLYFALSAIIVAIAAVVVTAKPTFAAYSAAKYFYTQDACNNVRRTYLGSSYIAPTSLCNRTANTNAGTWSAWHFSYRTRY